MLRLIVLVSTLSTLFMLQGCGPEAVTSAEKADQNIRMNEFLRSSSPRNSNGGPKAIPELRTGRKLFPAEKAEDAERPKSGEKW